MRTVHSLFTSKADWDDELAGIDEATRALVEEEPW